MPSRSTSRPQQESDLAIHPGELLAEELEVRGITQKALAAIMERPAQAVNEIVRGKKAITADTALQLEAVLGAPAAFWLNLQSQYDLVLARRAQAARITTRTTASRGRLVAVAETPQSYKTRTPRAPSKATPPRKP